MADSMKTSEEEEEVRPGISNTGAEVKKSERAVNLKAVRKENIKQFTNL